MKTITPWHERHMATNDPLMAGIHMEAEINELRRYIAELEAQLAAPAPTAPSDRERRWAKHLAKDESSDLACAECYPHGHLLKSGYKCVRHDAIALLATPAPIAPGVVVQLPDGDTRKITYWWEELRDGKLVVSIDVESAPAPTAPSERNAVLDEVAEYLAHLRDSAGDSSEHEKGSRFALNLAAEHIRGMKTEAPAPSAPAFVQYECDNCLSEASIKEYKTAQARCNVCETTGRWNRKSAAKS